MKSLFKTITLKQLTKSSFMFNQEITSLVKFNFGAKSKVVATKKTTPATKKEKEQTPKKPTKSKNTAYIEAEEVDVDLEEEEIVIPKKSKKKITASVEEEVVKAAPKNSKKSAKVKVPEEVEEVEEKEEVEVPTKKVTKKAGSPKTTQKVPDKNIWNINVYKNAYRLGRIPLKSETNPIVSNGFPYANSNSTDPYENYINSVRTTEATKAILTKERQRLCQNYSPLPVVIHEAKGAIIQDIDGFKYIDALTGYGSVNFGHSNENILKAMFLQASSLQMTSRALYNDVQHKAADLACRLFGKEKCIFMNSGVEAGETAVKFARRWGYRVKNLPENKASMVYMKGNFWGRTIHACGTSDDPSRYKDFGPYLTNDHLVEYNNVDALAEVLKEDPNICAVMLEPIQGEAGFIIPKNDYLLKVRQLCNEHNVLMICDEVQTGMGRTGRILASHWSLDANNSPDMIILAKSLSNGCYPVSCVLANASIIDLIKPGEHGSTFSGNPIAMSIAYQAMTELYSNEYAIVKNASAVGSLLATMIASSNYKFVKEVRGRGLMIGIEFQHNLPIKASDICLHLLERGLVTKPTHEYNIRIAPPLNSSTELILSIYEILNFVLTGLETNYPTYVPQDPQTNNISYTNDTIVEINKYAESKRAGDLVLNYSIENPLQKKYFQTISSNLNLNNINLSQPNLQVKQTQSNSTQIQTTEFPDLSEVSNASNEIDSHQQNSKPIMPSSLLSQNLNSANPQQKSQSHQKASNPIDQINNILKH